MNISTDDRIQSLLNRPLDDWDYPAVPVEVTYQGGPFDGQTVRMPMPVFVVAERALHFTAYCPRGRAWLYSSYWHHLTPGTITFYGMTSHLEERAVQHDS